MKMKEFFESATATFTYVVWDDATNKCAVIDSVLDYDQFASIISTKSADIIIDFIKSNGLSLEWILETHIHADHITAAKYIQKHLGGKIAIGSKIKEVLAIWVPIFNSYSDTKMDGSQFDCLLADGQQIELGTLRIKVLETPGHTPACCSYFIEDALFVGDTIFMPDIGTARTDFPGGSAEDLYNSISKILALPDETRIFVGHDYPPDARKALCVATVATQKASNIMINSRISKEEYIKMRSIRDAGKDVPKLLLPSLQMNMRAGEIAKPESNGTSYVKLPVRFK